MNEYSDIFLSLDISEQAILARDFGPIPLYCLSHRNFKPVDRHRAWHFIFGSTGAVTGRLSFRFTFSKNYERLVKDISFQVYAMNLFWTVPWLILYLSPRSRGSQALVRAAFFGETPYGSIRGKEATPAYYEFLDKLALQAREECNTLGLYDPWDCSVNGPLLQHLWFHTLPLSKIGEPEIDGLKPLF